MKRSAFLVAALGAALAGPAARADEVPKFDLQVTCRSGSSGDPGHTSRFCMESEQEARAELERRWTSFKPESRRECSQETRIGGLPSYVQVPTCIELAEGKLTATPPAGGQPPAGQ